MLSNKPLPRYLWQLIDFECLKACHHANTRLPNGNYRLSMFTFPSLLIYMCIHRRHMKWISKLISTQNWMFWFNRKATVSICSILNYRLHLMPFALRISIFFFFHANFRAHFQPFCIHVHWKLNILTKSRQLCNLWKFRSSVTLNES